MGYETAPPGTEPTNSYAYKSKLLCLSVRNATSEPSRRNGFLCVLQNILQITASFLSFYYSFLPLEAK